jgi:hypothetical protein
MMKKKKKKKKRKKKKKQKDCQNTKKTQERYLRRTQAACLAPALCASIVTYGDVLQIRFELTTRTENTSHQKALR